MRESTRDLALRESVEYYVATPGIPGAELALLTARGAILAHRRYHLRPGYTRWYSGSMAKVVLRAAAEEITELAATHDGLAIPEPPDVPLLAVFRPRPKRQAAFVSHLKLYSGRVSPVAGVEWPNDSLHVPLFVNVDLDLSAGKLAAQVAHAVLILQAACVTQPVWDDWLSLGLPLALLSAPERLLRCLVDEKRALAVLDEGRTEIARGSLTVAVGAPGNLGQWRSEPGVRLLAHEVGRPAQR